uniref:Monocarboxylate transporter 13-like n=1 Tax=Saccoglossus kowalevskii TaxID=10224 RepID=A0ABM0M6Z3_SACKO|nr:PREDICTED: monocarboxylate transporter 13-like [Saccoglossus kowalevskii]
MSFGVIYVALLDAFGESRAKTALVGSLTYIVLVLVNPYTGALSDRVGHRPVVVCGGVFASISLILSSFSTSLNQMYITFGVMAGLGYGCAHLPSMHMVSKYFNKKLPIATGIALSGSGFGMFLFSVVTQSLLDTYGWRGTLIVLSGMALNLCVAGVTFRPLNGCKTAENITMLGERQQCRNSEDKLNCNTDTSSPSSERTTEVVSKRCTVKRAREFGIAPMPAASLIAVMGISQTIGRLLAGVIANQKGVNRLLFYQSSIALSGVCMIASIYADNYPGMIRDSTGAYVWTFYYGGFCCLFAASIMCLMPLAGRCQSVNKDNDVIRKTTSDDQRPSTVIVGNETSV